MKVLYLGDSPAGGPANYLLGILGSLKAQVRHTPPGEIIPSSYLRVRPDLIIISDYEYRLLSPANETSFRKWLDAGTGLLMIGGWASFAGPFGGWQNSTLTSYLPVQMKSADDRVQHPTGAILFPEANLGLLKGLSFSAAPAICGWNQVQVKKDAQLILSVQKIISSTNKKAVLKWDKTKHPLLAIRDKEGLRSAAFTTDAAPHWCGGLVDWGTERMRLKSAPGIYIEVGDLYVRLLQNILLWTAK